METRRQIFILVAITIWLVAIGAGLAGLLSYENRPGASLSAPPEWPHDSRIQQDKDRPTLVMLAHPHCPCTRASIGELARLMTEANGRLSAYVLFVKPEIFSTEWEKTDLWESAGLIPGVRVMKDDAGVEARRFHALTSGQTVLYDKNGKLLFSGGITSARGHAGDNPGRSAIVSLVETGEANQRHTDVFGCALFSGNEECPVAEGEGH
jgi:hypothetical protein